MLNDDDDEKVKLEKQQSSDRYEFTRENAEKKNDESDANSCVKTFGKSIMSNRRVDPLWRWRLQNMSLTIMNWVLCNCRGCWWRIIIIIIIVAGGSNIGFQNNNNSYSKRSSAASNESFNGVVDTQNPEGHTKILIVIVEWNYQQTITFITIME